MRFDPAIEMPINDKLSLIVRLASFNRLAQVVAEVGVYNGSGMHIDSIKTGIHADRKKLIKAVAQKEQFEAGEFEKALLDLNDLLIERLMRKDDPTPEAAAPTVEILDNAPPTIRKPLSLIDEHVYAAVWVNIKTTRTEGRDDDGNLIKYEKPQVETQKAIWIVRDDGMTFGDGASASFQDLEIDIKLKMEIERKNAWSVPGLKSYIAGYRPDPVDIFNRIANIVDRFIDFDHSLGPQRLMSELIACFILSTWFMECFNVAGFIWPNGGAGSGKSTLLSIIAALSHLGQAIQASGTFAALRDMADYGAALCFDDAENLANPRTSDPDKLTMLLAGNRRGSTVPVKEQMPDGTWQIRFVSTFCPRAFSAIEIPYAVLASRTIIVPLVKSAVREKTNTEVLDETTWPHDRIALVDDLWAVAISRSLELRGFERAVNSRARLTGRNLEPWRSLLAIALWLDQQGAGGLWQRIEQLSVDYQDEREEMEAPGLARLVIRALFLCIIEMEAPDEGGLFTDSTDSRNTADSSRVGVWVIQTQKIRETVVALIEDEESDFDVESIKSPRSPVIGKMLGQTLRLKKRAVAHKGKKREWKVTISDIKRLGRGFSVELPDFIDAEKSDIKPADLSPTTVGSAFSVGTVGSDEEEF